jgi:molecular chaperone DnaJ
MPSTRDYYEILGVSREEAPEEIKRAYRRLAMKYHPDRNPGDAEAEARFKECAEAYEILSDPERRARYNKFGHAGLRGTPHHDFRTMNVEDIFSMFTDIFGGGFNAGPRGRQRGVPRGYDLETEVELTLKDVLTGTTRDVEFQRLDVCGHCGGNGAKPGSVPSTCQTCGGHGQVAQAGLGGMFRMVMACTDCGGRGKVVLDKCPDCRGRGRVPVKRLLSVKVPAGVQSGQAVRVAGEGEPPAPELSPARDPGRLAARCDVPHRGRGAAGPAYRKTGRSGRHRPARGAAEALRGPAPSARAVCGDREDRRQ